MPLWWILWVVSWTWTFFCQELRRFLHLATTQFCTGEGGIVWLLWDAFFFGGKCSWSKQSTLDISLERVVGRTSANGLEVMGFIQLYEAITVHAFAIEHVRYPAITLFVNWNSCSLFEVLTRKYFLTTQPFQHSSTERFVDNSHFQQDGSLLVLMWL